MNIIKNETIEFIDFYKRLCGFLNENGVLENLTVIDCVIKNVPNNYPVLQYKKVEKIFGITVATLHSRFCGFVLDDKSVIVGNYFKNFDDTGKLKKAGVFTPSINL